MSRRLRGRARGRLAAAIRAETRTAGRTVMYAARHTADPAGRVTSRLARPAARWGRRMPSTVWRLGVVLGGVVAAMRTEPGVAGAVPAAGQAFAAVPGAPAVVLAQAQSVEQVIANAQNWITGISVGIAGLCFSVAGLRMMFASGDPAQIAHAKEAIKYGCVGLAIAFLFRLIIAIVSSIAGVGG